MTPPNSPQPDISFEEFLQEALQFPCPCDACQQELLIDTVTHSQRQLEYLNNAWLEILEMQETVEYEPPSVSPTNQEMHAVNGNIESADIHSRLLDRPPTPHPEHERIKDLLNPGRIRARHHKRRFPGTDGILTAIEEIQHLASGDKSDDYLYPGMSHNAQEVFEEVVKLQQKHPDWKNSQHLQPPPHKHKPRTERIITNKEQHAKNGNESLFGNNLLPNWSERLKIKPPPPRLKKLKPIPPPVKHDKDYDNNKGWDWVPNHPNLENTQTLYDKLAKGENPAQIVAKRGPTNKEQHSYNGNINPVAGALEALARNKVKNKQRKKQRKSKPRPPARRRRFWRPRNRTVAKAHIPKVLRKTAKIEKLEDRVARSYNRFLYYPALPPPRLGSTGNTPTKLIHGFYQQIIEMDTIDFGSNNTLGNATTLLAFLSPRMFSIFSTTTSYAAPITVCLGATNSQILDNTVGGAGTSSTYAVDFTNATSMKNEVLNTTSTTTARVLSRWLGGSISIECRCPMTTTAPPFIYGGLLPANVGSDSYESADVGRQLSTQTGAQIQQLKSSTPIQGFTGSAVYVPNSPDALLFNSATCQNDGSGVAMPVSAIPYIIMNGCPTAATVVINVSCWFEIQQTKDNAYYSGWRLGPKVSSEDIYDRLTRKTPVSSRVISQGAKESSGISATMQVMQNINKRNATPPEPTVFDQIRQLKQEIRNLRVKIDEEEDEKYFDQESTPTLDKQDTPVYSSLSKSTLDLAMSLKKSLTPGSVTSKTVLKSPQ